MTFVVVGLVILAVSFVLALISLIREQRAVDANGQDDDKKAEDRENVREPVLQRSDLGTAPKPEQGAGEISPLHDLKTLHTKAAVSPQPISGQPFETTVEDHLSQLSEKLKSLENQEVAQSASGDSNLLPPLEQPVGLQMGQTQDTQLLQTQPNPVGSEEPAREPFPWEKPAQQQSAPVEDIPSWSPPSSAAPPQAQPNKSADAAFSSNKSADAAFSSNKIEVPIQNSPNVSGEITIGGSANKQSFSTNKQSFSTNKDNPGNSGQSAG